MHIITVKSKTADILPLGHMCSMLNNWSNVLMLWKEKKNKPKGIEGCSLECFQRSSWMVRPGRAVPLTAPHHFLQLTTALRANLGDFSSMLLQLRWQQGRLDVVERSPYPRHRGEKVLWDSPSKDMDGGTGRDSFPNKPEKYTCLSLGSEHPNKIILICEPKRKKLTFPYWHPLSLLSPVPSPGWLPQRGSFIPLQHRKPWTYICKGKKNCSKPPVLRFWSSIVMLWITHMLHAHIAHRETECEPIWDVKII